MAYTPIQPLPIEERPLLGAVSEGLSYIRQTNELKRQEALKRQDEIVKKLSDVDFPTAINMQNKKMQVKLYKAAENSIMNILSKSAKRGGQITVEERLEADRVVKTLQNELNSFTKGEEEFTKIMEVAAKEPGRYSPESLKAYSDNYVMTGQSNNELLQFSPVPFSVMQNNALDIYKDRLTSRESLVGDKIQTVKSSNLTGQEKQEAYQMFASSMPGYGVWEKEQFMALPENEKQSYLKLTNGNLDKAARNWGLDSLAPELIPEAESMDLAPENKLKKDKSIIEIKGRKLDDGKIEYITGGKGQVYSGFVKTLDNEELSVDRAKVSRIMYDPYDKDHGVIELTVTGTKEVPFSASFEGGVATMTKGGSEKSTETYKVPYDQLSPFINNNYNLLDLEQVKKQQPKFIGVPSGGF